jgi:hypothetical protein
MVTARDVVVQLQPIRRNEGRDRKGLAEQEPGCARALSSREWLPAITDYGKEAETKFAYCPKKYYNRFANHEQSAKLEKDVYLRIERKMEEIQTHSNLSWIEVQFMKRAVDTLSACRATLKWTYAMAFYLKKDNATIIFEDNQKWARAVFSSSMRFCKADVCY